MIRRISDDLLWGQIVALAWCDEALMRRLLSEPRDVLAEHGLEVPEGVGVQVVEGAEVHAGDLTDGVRRFTFPAAPPDDLTEEDLVGGAVAWCFSGVCAASAACGRCACRCSCRCACRCF
jgi:hypothetical protein